MTPTVLAEGGWLQGVMDKATGDPLQVLALLAQGVFASRFLVQWLESEKQRKVVVPAAFWWLSIAGSVLLFGFFAAKQEPVMMLVQIPQVGLYFRNLAIHRRAVREAARPT